MQKELVSFLKETTKDSFLALRQVVISNEAYDPYSGLPAKMQVLINENRFHEALEIVDINLLLSPRAHLVRRYAFEALKKVYEAKYELLFARKICEGIELSGAGTIDSPYIVTSVADEKDFLGYLGEQPVSQALHSENAKHLDRITTASGRVMFFDVTEAFERMQRQLAESGLSLDEVIGQPKQSKWWKFW